MRRAPSGPGSPAVGLVSPRRSGLAKLRGTGHAGALVQTHESDSQEP